MTIKRTAALLAAAGIASLSEPSIRYATARSRAKR